MTAEALYSATVTTVPIIFLALVADRGTLFGPTSTRPGTRRLDLLSDVLFLVGGIAASSMAVTGLAQVDPPDMRTPVAWFLGLAIFAAFLHVLAGALTLYGQRPVDGGPVQP